MVGIAGTGAAMTRREAARPYLSLETRKTST
jgi:hypothetical protein